MSSSCHGGGTGKNQGLIFAKLDVHKGALAILSSSRSQRIAEALQLPSAARSQRCVVCHSPQQTVPANRFVKPGTPDLAISCETCHGPAEPWLRAHTRPDFTHELRVAEGLRDLSTPYQRANACVACHLNLEPEIRRAGHPEMFFELDGQLASQPPHWKEKDPWHGPRAWLTGQAVALRELSWKLGSHPDAELNLRWRALIWLLQRADAGGKLAPTMSYSAMQEAADQLAQGASAQPWSREKTARLLRSYAASGEDFRKSREDRKELRRRAEVLVLALDRLWQPLKTQNPSSTYDEALAVLVQEARAQDSFSQDRFAAALQQMEVALERLPAF
jgi:hypothetical protein